MGYYKLITTMIFLAMITFGVIKFVFDDQVSIDLKEKFVKEAGTNKLATFFFVKFLDDMTPTLSYKLPFTDKKFFGLNEFLFFGFNHTFIILLIVWIAGSIIESKKLGIPTQIIVYILLILVGYYVASWIIYFLYYTTAFLLKFTYQEATQFRHEYGSNFKNIILPLVITMLIGIVGVTKAIFIKAKN